MTIQYKNGRMPTRTFILCGVCAVSLSACSWFSSESSDELAMTAPQQKEASIWNAPTLASNSPANVAVAPLTTAVAANATNKSDVESRLAALENNVSGIRNDMNMMMPALTRLAEAQNNLHDVLDRIQPAAGVETQQISAAAQAPMDMPLPAQAEPMDLASMQQQSEPIPVRKAAPMPIQMPTQTARAAAPTPQYASASGKAVQQVRFGEHPGKTRLVLDVSANSAFKYDIDNTEHLLMVDLPATAWTTTAQQNLASSPLVASYNAAPDGKGGTRLAIQLKQAAQVGWAQSIASPETGGSRIVIDVMPI
jgi:hypothetical protein